MSRDRAFHRLKYLMFKKRFHPATRNSSFIDLACTKHPFKYVTRALSIKIFYLKLLPLLLTFASELSVVLSGAFVTTYNTLNILVLITTINTVLRVLRRRLSVADEREIGVFQRDGVQIGGQRV